MRRAILAMLSQAFAACVAPDPVPDKAPNRIGDFNFVEESEFLDFAYSFPAPAAAIPALSQQLRADLARIKSEAIGYATGDSDSAKDSDRPFHGHYLHKEWGSLGETRQLLSLTALIETFTGGAHGNSGFAALLWDRERDREVSLASLFQSPATLEQSTRTAYCKALDSERLKRRQGETIEGQFSECPKYSELVVAPADEDGNGRFDHVSFLAGPYVAGPYVEGAYEISMPLPADLVTAIKPGFQASFEAQPQ